MLISVRLLLRTIVANKTKIIVLGDRATIEYFEEFLADLVDNKDIWMYETTDPHRLKFINSRNPGQILVWASTATHDNLITALENRAIPMAYADTMFYDVNCLQKFAVQKIHKYIYIGTNAP